MMVTVERIPTATALEMKFYEAHWPVHYMVTVIENQRQYMGLLNWNLT
jgi:hypothetical protein